MHSFFKLIGILAITLFVHHAGYAATSASGDEKRFIQNLESFLCKSVSDKVPPSQIYAELAQKFGKPFSRTSARALYEAFQRGEIWTTHVGIAYPNISALAVTPHSAVAPGTASLAKAGNPAPANALDPAAQQIADQLLVMGFNPTTETIEANLEVLEDSFPDLRTNPHLRIAVACTLKIKPPLTMITRLPVREQLSAAKALKVDVGPDVLQGHFLSQLIFHNGSSTWFSGFKEQGNDPLCPHYHKAFPKIPVVHQYNPEVSTDGGWVPLVFNVDAQLYSLLPARVQGAIKPAEEIGIVFQSMQQLTAGSDGLCFRPQTWISPNGAAFSGNTTIQWLEPSTDKAVSLSSEYSIHDGVSSPNSPRLETKPADDPFVCWSRIQWNKRSILTAHVFVPFGMDTFLRRFEFQTQAPQTVGAFYDALLHVLDGFEAEVRGKIRAETAAGKAPTEDDMWISNNLRKGVRRVFEEDLGGLFRK